MRKDEILEVLSDWNFWANKEIDVGIKRDEYVAKLIDLITKTNQIVCIVGVRRSGKSTIMKQLAKELGGDKNTLIVNFEDERFAEKTLKLLMDASSVYFEKVRPEKTPFIFLDEVQNIPDWEKFARGMHERHDARIVVSGSSSKLLSEELATLLAGRHVVFDVYPLSFREFVVFKGARVESEVDMLAKRAEIKRLLLPEYMEFGGFPEVSLSAEKNRVLLGYFETIITKDVVDRYKIREKEKVKTLAKYYLTNAASHVTFNRIANFLDMPLTTVERFSGHLETANALFFVKRFSYSLKEQEKSPRKVYSIDTGLSNVVGFRFDEKIGRTMENVVAMQLRINRTFRPEIEFYYWKDPAGNKEVDFVVKEGLKVRRAIQVCRNLSELETKERELNGLLKAMEEFGLREGFVITEDLDKEETIEDKTIVYVPLWKWLLTRN